MKRVIRATQTIEASNKLFETTMGGLNYIAALAKMLDNDLDKAVPKLQRLINEGEIEEAELEKKFDQIENIHSQLSEIYTTLQELTESYK